MQLIIYAGRSASRITISRSLSIFAGALSVIVFFTDIHLTAVATFANGVTHVYLLVGSGGRCHRSPPY